MPYTLLPSDNCILMSVIGRKLDTECAHVPQPPNTIPCSYPMQWLREQSLQNQKPLLAAQHGHLN